MKLKREILRLAVPSILANITVPLVGMVDIAVVGHLGGSGAALIGGISIGTMLFDLLYWNFAFLRAGTGGLTAQAYGRQMADQAGHDDSFLPGPDHSPGNEDSVMPDPDHSVMHGHNSPVMPGPDRASSAIETILRRALRIALLSALALILLQWMVVKAAFLVVVCSPEVQALATRYFYIRIWAAPATLSLFAFKGWFIGLQDSVRPMTADLLVNGLNIVLSVVLGFGLLGLPALGFSGVAVGTVLAQWAGFAYCLFAARRRYTFSPRSNLLSLNHLRKSNITLSNITFKETTGNQGLTLRASGADGAERTEEADGTDGGREDGAGANEGTGARETKDGSFFTLNRDLFLRSVGMIAVYIGFTVLSARYGDLVLAVSSILMKLLMIFSYFTDGFAYAGEALTGRFIGEKSVEGVKSTVRDTYLLTVGVMLLFLLLYGIGGTPLLRLMTSDTSVVEAGKAYLPWLLLMPLIGCPTFVWDGIFIGATASKDLRNSTLLCAAGFFATWLIGCQAGADTAYPLHLLMGAYFMHLLIRSAYLTARYKPAVLSPLLHPAPSSGQTP